MEKERIKKVGIINFACADNFGAVLQAYALEKIIRDHGFDSETINFKPKYIMGQYNSFNNIDVAIKSLRLHSVLKKIFLGFKNMKKEKKRRNCFRDFREKNMVLSKKEFYTPSDLLNDNLDYDFFITGSDQVWNPIFKKNIGNSFFLDFAPENKPKIAYAASIAENVDKSMSNEYKVLIGRFDHISLREISSVPFVRSLINKEVKVTLDPTLLLEKDDWQYVLKEPLLDDKFILVYDLEYSEDLVYIANEFANRLGYKIVSYSKKLNFKNGSRSFKYEGPSELLGYINNAELVLTNSFHGTVFSVIFQKQFYTIPHTTRGSRMIDFLNTLNLSDRIIQSRAIPGVEFSINYNSVNEKLDVLKKDSLEFLLNGLDVKGAGISSGDLNE